MKLLRRLRDWLRPKMPVVNIGLALAAWWANGHVNQVFCRPVPWAAWTLGLTTSAFLLWPWLRRGPSWAQYLALFLQAVLLLVCFYCLWFFGWSAYFVALVLTVTFSFLWEPSVLLLWVPLLFGMQVVKRLRVNSLPKARLVFGTGILLPLLGVGWADYQFRQIEAAVAQLPPVQRRDADALVRVVPRNFIAERLAGVDFKYHNYFCVFDGTRPALHDPLVNVCLWWRGGSDAMAPAVKWDVNPLRLEWVSSAEGAPADWYKQAQFNLNRQATLYHRLFPNQPLNAGCDCTLGHGTITVQVN